MSLFTTLFYQPIFNLLIWFYNVIPGQDIGLAIIALTIVIKLILAPFTLKQLRSQKALQALQPKIDAIRAQYKDEKDKMMKEMMALYKAEKASPFSSCLVLLIQLPFLWAVYRAFSDGLSAAANGLNLLYPFVERPETIHTMFLGIVDLSKSNIPIAVLAGIAQWWQAKLMQTKQPPKALQEKTGAKDENMAAMMNKQMLYFMPAFTVLIGASLPGGLALYWLLFTLLTAVQQYIMVNRPVKKETDIIEAEVVEKK